MLSFFLVDNRKCLNLTLKLTQIIYGQFMLTIINFLFILRKRVNCSVKPFSNRNMNSILCRFVYTYQTLEAVEPGWLTVVFGCEYTCVEEDKNDH